MTADVPLKVFCIQVLGMTENTLKRWQEGARVPESKLAVLDRIRSVRRRGKTIIVVYELD